MTSHEEKIYAAGYKKGAKARASLNTKALEKAQKLKPADQRLGQRLRQWKLGIPD